MIVRKYPGKRLKEFKRNLFAYGFSLEAFNPVTFNCWLQHLIPFALVFEHDFAEQTNLRHAVIEELVVEFLQ